MTKILERISGNEKLIASLQNCEKEVTPILQGFITNFPEYTDHSINHSKKVLEYAEEILNVEVEKLNADEAYVLIMAGFLHDIGMCPTNEMKANMIASTAFKESNKSFENYLRDVHHLVSYEYITTKWRELKIENEAYAEAIALVGMGHRKVDLLDFDTYNPEFVVKNGRNFVCLPYLAAVLRLADELDITNDRTPDLLYNEYFPSNKISKEEWEKHKANYYVNFKRDTIKITSKCYDKDLYYALLKQYNKIESVMKYAHSVTNKLPHDSRQLKIDCTKIERNVKTFGFTPKEIGFSFDLQNTINTFIGDNIYKDKFVAIRECLQNCIDSCRYKKQLSRNIYTPLININLSNNELTISDNGLGMDEFIVENYFARLSKSYYNDNKISENFEAISNFGIGVFSYFLLCDYFEVESKQDGKPPIKLRATKDAETYFHFFDDSQKTEAGTRITLFLKDGLLFEDLIEQVKYYIRFLEFPINLIYNGKTETIISDDFTIGDLELLKGRIDEYKFDEIKQLELLQAEIDNEVCKGTLGLLFQNVNGTYTPISSYSIFSHGTSNIELSQKGVFVGNIEYPDIRNAIGKINLKRKNEIDIGRYNIKNYKQVSSVVKLFVEDILVDVFNNWKMKSLVERANLCTRLVDCYFEYRNDNFYLTEKFFDDFIVSVFTGQKTEYLTLNELLLLEEIIIINDESPFGNSNYAFEDVDRIYDTFKKPLLLQKEGSVAWSIFCIMIQKNRNIEIVTTNKHWFYLINNKISSYDHDSISKRYSIASFDTPHICAYPSIFVDRTFNKGHEIVKYYVANKPVISNHHKLNQLFEKFFIDMAEFIYKCHKTYDKIKNPSVKIEQLNSLLADVNEIQGTSFKLKQEDFPIWVNKGLIW